MAIIKFVGAIHPRASGDMYAGVKKCIDYISNPAKTSSGKYAGYNHCLPKEAADNFISTTEYWGKASHSEHNRLAYHFIISFKDNDGTTEEQAFHIVEDFCNKYLNDYESVYTVHNDKEHMHCHICFNATAFETGLKYHYDNGDWFRQVQPVVDKLCIRYGCNTLEDDTDISLAEYEEQRKNRKAGNKGKNRNEKTHSNCSYYNEKRTKKICRMDIIRNDIDEVILLSSSFEEFVKLMQERGYTVRYGENIKHMTVRQFDGGSNRRVDTLDKNGYYSEAMIRKRIEDKEKETPLVPVNTNYRFILPKPYLVYRLPRRELTKAEKKYYARMYRLGMFPKEKKISYRQIKNNLREIEKNQRKINLLEKCLENPDKNPVSFFEEEKAVQETALEEINRKCKTYRLLFKAVNEMKKEKNGHDSWLMGNAAEKDNYLKYEEAASYLAQFGYSYETAVKLKEDIFRERRELKKNIREQEEQIEFVKEIINDEEEPETEAIYRELEAQDRQLQMNEIIQTGGMKK